MSNYYVYKELEDLVHELNPSIIQPFPLTEEKVKLITEKIIRLKAEVQSALQDMIYRNTNDESTGQIIRKSYQSLVWLINKTFETRQHEAVHRTNVHKPLDKLLHIFDQLLHWFHQHYNSYITSEQPYPITRLKSIRSMILEKMDSVRGILHAAGNHDDAISVVTNALNEFVERIDRMESITRHEVEYHEALLEDIEVTKGHSPIVSNCPSLHELLVYWNLNSKESISYFTKGLEQIINSFPTREEQLEYLRLQYKYVLQMPELPNFIYNPRYPSIKQYFGDYLLNEIEYLTNKTAGFLPSVPAQPVPDHDKPSFKVMCDLSGDQISLILRAGAELKLLEARSMNVVFKAVVPYLSTRQKENLSWQAMRSKSYSGEQRDKQIAIAALQRMIEKIEEY